MPYVTTILTGVFVALWSLIGDAGETYDLTNIGTLFAFALVCIGVIVLRYTDPERQRPFRVPFVHVVGMVGAAAVRIRDAGSAEPRVGPIRLVARDRARAVLRVRVPHSTLRRGTGPIVPARRA